MNMLIQHVQNIVSMDRPTLMVIAVLCGIAALFLKEYLANPPMIIFVYPVLVLLSILAQYGFILAETYPQTKLDLWLMWTILSAIIGTISGTVLIACLSAFRDHRGNARART